MALLLSIDTALGQASVVLSVDGDIVRAEKNENLHDQAAWLHPVIKKIFADTGYLLKQLDAVAVTIGPGSYTGLRIGLATAKGLCYAAQLPVIAVNTLELMAFSEKEKDKELICPMIDARRMEVFTAVYSKNLQQVLAPCAMVIGENSFSELLNKQPVLFTGNAVDKVKPLLQHPHAFFSTDIYTAQHLCDLSTALLQEKKFSDIAYLQPFYVKDFYDAKRDS